MPRKVTIGNAELWLGDCLEILPTLPKVNLYFTSPPYNQNLQAFKPSGMHKESRWVERISSSYYDTMPEDEYQEWQVRVLDACLAQAHVDGSIFYNHKVRWRDGVPIFPISWVLKSKWIPRQEIIWARNGSVTQNARMFPPSEERIFWLRNQSWKWVRDDPKLMSVWRVNSAADTEHPVAFPLELPTRAIASVSDKDDTVCDPFMGSGTTGVACMNLGRKFIGIEIEPKYFDIACRRIEDAQRQQRLIP